MKLLTYNVAMLPDPLGTDKATRAKYICDEIMKCDYDIICLQEVFSEPIRKIFDNRLKGKYPYRKIKSDDNDFLNEDSGLFFASKFPFSSDTKFQEFFDNQPLTGDSISDKGIFGAKLLVKNSQNKDSFLYVFNTHLQSTEAYYEVRKKQIGQIRRFVAKALRNNVDSACLLCGDFNVIGDAKNEYSSMLINLSFVRDLYRDAHPYPDNPGYTWDGVNNKFIHKTAANDKDQQRLDYIFAFDEVPIPDDNAGAGTQLRPVNVTSIEVKTFEKKPYDNNTNLSDHYGLEMEFNI
jgi:endonuclease/exonuclease/phosphatase family metal-dependent hydrolase